MTRSAFFTVHRDLPREGPGTPQDVHWALDAANTPLAARICDAGCGPGADTGTLAQARPDADIYACDQVPHFVAAARRQCAGFGPRVQVAQASMAELDGRFDLIWCAGAVYFLGITDALNLWRAHLRPGGKVAFSEPVLSISGGSDGERRFWAEYPQATDLPGIEALVVAANFRVVATRRICGAAWQAYYTPMQARLDSLRSSGADADPDIRAALDAAQAEIDNWKAAADEIAYQLCVVAPA